MTTWLPRCLTRVKPNRSSTRIASAPEMRGSLGIGCLKSRQKRSAALGKRKLLEVQFRGLFQIGHCFLHGRSLADRADFRALGHVKTLFPGRTLADHADFRPLGLVKAFFPMNDRRECP